MQESKSQSYFTASSQIITFFLLNKQQRGRVERTSASRNLRKTTTFGKQWSYISELLLALRTICLDNFSFQYRNNPPKLHAPSLIERIGNAPIFLHSPCATQVKIDWGKFSKTAREENFWGGEKWRRSKHTPVMRYAETRRGEGWWRKVRRNPGWPWPRGENRGKSGFHGNRNPHLEDDLSWCVASPAQRHRSFRPPGVIEWCMPTIHRFFIQRK